MHMKYANIEKWNRVTLSIKISHSKYARNQYRTDGVYSILYTSHLKLHQETLPNIQ